MNIIHSICIINLIIDCHHLSSFTCKAANLSTVIKVNI